jgi:hypothetical protein
MRIIFQAALALLLLAGPAAGTALAVTASQLVDLMKAGLGDDVLIALIQTDGSTFQLTAADILALHRQGLSDKVILAMQATARKAPAKVAERETAIQPRAESQEIESVVRDQTIPTAPQVVNVYQTVSQRVESARAPSTHVLPVPYMVPVYVRPIPVKPAAPPVYWGWNGQRRPDTWQESPQPDPAAAKAVTPAKKGGL